MRILIRNRYIELFTETSANQLKVLVILSIVGLQALNMLTVRWDTLSLGAVFATLAAISGVKVSKRLESQGEPQPP